MNTENSPNNYTVKITKSDLLKSIPSNYLTIQNLILSETKTEWRWRIFKFPHKANDVVEISYRKINGDRIYFDKFGNWVNSSVPNDYDSFVTEIRYTYTD